MVAASTVSGATAPGLQLARRGAAGLAVLDRPDRANQISRSMLAALATWYPTLARDPGVYAVVVRSAVPGIFSRGADVGELLALAATDAPAARSLIQEKYAVCWLHECFSKPTVSLIDGDVSGAGIAITLYGTHRVAGDGYRLCFNATANGWFPDCGLRHALARMPQAIGSYLALTGAPVGPADALDLGLVTHCIPATAFADIEAHLADADPVDPILDDRHRRPEGGAILREGERISRYFETTSLAETVARLSGPRAADTAWAAAQLTAIRGRSPLALCLAHRAVQRATGHDIRETLIEDYRLASHLLAAGELREAAAGAEPANAPGWGHARIEDVPEALVVGFFGAPEAGDLALASREEMQAARV